MDCDEVRTLIDAYADNELDLVTSLDIERHLADCADCPTIYQNRLTLKAALQSESPYFRPSPALQQKMRRHLPFEPNERAWPRWALSGLGALAALLVIFLAGFALRTAALRSEAAPVVQAVLASHIRSLMVDHLTDVASSDRHTVKPWFDGKIPYAPNVIDLAAQGFPLVGGRLDYVQDSAVAALVYRSDKHTINLFVWPVDTLDETTLGQTSQEGYHLLSWRQGGMVYWAVSDLEVEKLAAFKSLIQAGTA